MSSNSMPAITITSSLSPRRVQALQRSLSTTSLLPHEQKKMPVRLFPANRVLASTGRGLSALVAELHTVDSSHAKSRSELTHIRLRFDLLVDNFEDEKVRLSKKAFTRVLYRRDMITVEKNIVRVRRGMERINRNVEWTLKQIEMNAARESANPAMGQGVMEFVLGASTKSRCTLVSAN